MRHTHREIETAKMFIRRLDELKNVQVTLLSRLRSSVVLWARSFAFAVQPTVLRKWREMRGLKVCPDCNGAGEIKDYPFPGTWRIRSCTRCKKTGFVKEHKR